MAGRNDKNGGKWLKVCVIILSIMSFDITEDKTRGGEGEGEWRSGWLAGGRISF